MSNRSDLAEAEARVAALKAKIAAETCATNGHQMKHVGGTNAGCGRDCCCSVPVHACVVCGDSDYGKNPEADEKRLACAAEDRARADEDWFFDMDGKP